MPKVDNKRIRFLTPAEADLLLSALKKRSRQVYEIACISLYQGMRFSEVANLKGRDIDLENGIITIRDPKNKTSRVSYMTDKVRSIFEGKDLAPDELVFKGQKGGPIKSVPKTFFRVVEKLGLNKDVEDPRDKVVFHTLRHTFCSWLALRGTPVHVIAKLAGHKDTRMTTRYSHLLPNTEKEAIKLIDQIAEEDEGKVVFFKADLQ